MSEIDPLIGTVLADRYRIERLVGQGAMGRVYQAEHVHMRKRVALKVLHRELMTVPEIVQRFEREARAAAHMDHPHVAAATDFGKLTDGSVYLVLEFVEGVSLSKVIESAPLDVRRVLRIALQVASALQVAHHRGIVHRDLKPDNLCLVDGEEEDYVKVLDFGIAKVPPEKDDKGKAITQIGMVYGTPEYMAPEQALGQDVDGRADLYALGVIMYEMTTGRRPYIGPSVGLLGQQLSTPLPRMAHVAAVRVPAAVERLVFEMLAPDVNVRIANADVVVDQLEALLTAMDEGRLAGYGDRAGTLLSISLEEVTTRIEQVTKNIPQPVKKVMGSRLSRAALTSLAFGAIGVAAAIFLVGLFVGEKKQEPADPSVGTMAAPLVSEVEEDTRHLEQRLAKAKDEGLHSLIELGRQIPTEGIVHAELSLELAKAKRYEEALDAARVALALDPQLNENPKIAGALFRTAQSNVARSSAFRLLQGAMGVAGLNILYDLAHTDGVSESVKTQAMQALRSDSAKALAPPSLQLVVSLEDAKTCKDIPPLVESAKSVGDKRAVPLLRELESQTGCGRNKSEDCYPCLRRDDSLEVAIRAIEQRGAAPQDAAPASP